MKSLLFDLDGTIIDSRESVAMSIQAAINDLYGNYDLKLNINLTGQTLKEISDHFSLIYPNFSHNDFTALFKKYYDNRYCTDATLYDGALTMIKSLVGHHKLLVVTNKRSIPTQKILKYNSIVDCFEAVYCIDSFSTINNKGQLLKLVKSSLESTEILGYIGDTESDLNACVSNNIKFYHASWGYEPELSHVTSFASPYHVKFS